MKTKIVSILKNTREMSADLCRKASLAATAPSEKQAQAVLFTAGILLLAGSGLTDVMAQTADAGVISDGKIATAVNTIFLFLEGSFGALIMAASGIGAIMSAAFGQYKAALSCMVVAVGAFILRNLMRTFFNMDSIDQAPGADGNF
jgi:hypothetical protein